MDEERPTTQILDMDQERLTTQILDIHKDRLAYESLMKADECMGMRGGV